MTDRWHKRRDERQQFLNSLKQLAADQGGLAGASQFEFVAAIVAHYSGPARVAPPIPSPGHSFFQNVALPKIRDFSRGEAEETMLASDLLTWVVGDMANHNRQNLANEESRNPDRYFGSIPQAA